jgi:glutamine amidotransferase
VCRHLAYVGPPTTLSSLLLEPPHGLLHQSYAPADMRGGGTVNADGFGAGWYLAGLQQCHPADVGLQQCHTAAEPPPPVRYRSDRPIWTDPAFAALAAATSAGAILAAVRSGTPGMPVSATAAAPFGEGQWLFSHNGLVRGWPDTVAALAARLPVTDLLTLDAPTDSALLWTLVRHRLRNGADPADALRVVVAEIEAAAPGSRLNLLLTDGTGVWATAWTHALSVRTGPASVLVCSEPIDALPGWMDVPDRHLVVARPGHVDLTSLPPTAHEGVR